MPTIVHRDWFDADDAHGVAVAVITDDLHVEIGPLGTVSITGWGDGAVQLDFDDVADMAAVLAEAVRILADRGHRTAYPPRATELLPNGNVDPDAVETRRTKVQAVEAADNTTAGSTRQADS